MIDFPERGGEGDLLAAGRAHRRARRQLLPAGDPGLLGHGLPRPAHRSSSSCRRCSPTWFFAVPRIWEKLKAGLEAKLAGDPRRGGRAGARRGSRRRSRRSASSRRARRSPSSSRPRSPPADEALFSNLRAALGLDEAVAVNVGAAPTPLEVLEFFHAIGIPIGELWGMSETCGVATFNPPEQGQARHRRAADPRDRDQARRRRRGAGPGRRRTCSATATCRRRPPRRSTPRAGWRPATSASSTPTAT